MVRCATHSHPAESNQLFTTGSETQLKKILQIKIDTALLYASNQQFIFGTVLVCPGLSFEHLQLIDTASNQAANQDPIQTKQLFTQITDGVGTPKTLWAILNKNTTEIDCKKAAFFTVAAGGNSYAIVKTPVSTFLNTTPTCGDWVYLANTNSKANDGGYDFKNGQAGENLIYYADGMYFGHESGKPTLKTLGEWATSIGKWKSIAPQKGIAGTPELQMLVQHIDYNIVK